MKQGSLRRAWRRCIGKGGKQLCRKVLAVSLSAAMTVSFLPADRVNAASEAKQYVSMRTTFKTLQVGQKNRMTLKNNTAGWKIQKISTNDESIASVSGRTKDSFQIQAAAVGRTTVKAVLKTTSRKKHTSKTVRCRVNVIAKTEAEPQPEPPAAVTEKEVSTQEQLNEALSDSSLTKITIASQNAGKFVIAAGTHENVSLAVDAPAADIENSGVFKSIEIRAVKPDTWIEKAVGNVMRITAKAARLVIDPGAQVKEISLPQADADVKLEVNGKAEKINIESKMKLSVSGKPQADLSVTVDQKAADAQIVSETKLEVSLHAAALLTFEKGAEGSIVNLAVNGIKAAISNLTSRLISVKRPNGTSSNVQAGQQNAQISSDQAQNPGAGSSGAGSWSGTGSGSGSGTGSGSGSGSGTGSGSGSDTENPSSDIPAPTAEEVLEGFEARATIAVSGTTIEDAQVYWKTYLHLKEKNTETRESQPDFTLQYYNTGFKKWSSDTIGFSQVPFVSSDDSKLRAYKLTDSSQSDMPMRFRYVDQEGNAGEEIALKVYTWEAQTVRQYMEYYLNHQAADKKGKPFCVQMNIYAQTPEDDKIRMTYDEAYLSELDELTLTFFYRELPELPQWTGAGPVIPYIEGNEMLENLELDSAKISFVISGSSVQAVTEDSNASLTCHVEIPVKVVIPETVPDGKLLWFYKKMPWEDIAGNGNKVTFTVQYDSLSAILEQDYLRTEKVKFCYESAGGNHVNDFELTADMLDNSAVEIEPYSKEVLQSCLDELKNASNPMEPVLRQYEIQGLNAVKSTEEYKSPRVQPKAAGTYSIVGKDISEMPKDWQVKNP